VKGFECWTREAHLAMASAAHPFLARTDYRALSSSPYAVFGSELS
jgi:hypothetical protein